MHRSLMGRENGENEFLFHAPAVVRSLLASRLRQNKTKTFALGETEYYSCLDIDKQQGQYLLVAGQDKIQVYDILEPYQKPQQVASTVSDPENNTSRPIQSALWYPQDPGIFLTGDNHGHIVLWDTNEMSPVATYNFLEEEQEINAISMSRLPSAHNDLVAVASSKKTLNLLDISSGAFTHTLSAHDGRILDVVWSPRAPYLILTASADRTARLFDIRRGGSSSCLATLDLSKRMLRVEESFPSKGGPLGLGMIWKQPTLSARGKRMRRINVAKRLAPQATHLAPVLQCRFTSDGSRILTLGGEGVLYVWDSFSGHRLNSIHFPRLGASSDGLFEVGPDPLTLYAAQDGALAAYDLENFGELSRSKRQRGGIQKICTHPHLVDVCFITNSRRVMWLSPKRFGKTKTPRYGHDPTGG